MTTEEIEDSRTVYVVIGNTDLTEGKGRSTVENVCWYKSTAKRYGKGRYVMGSDCPIREDKAYLIGGTWYAPSTIINPSVEDKKLEAHQNAIDAVIKRARDAGLADEDIKLLTEGRNK